MARRLAAILAADMVGYSRLMSKDESGTLAALRACEAEVIEPIIGEHGGRIVKKMGDGYLAEFASVVDAVDCAVGWQKRVSSRKNGSLVFRIGINLGDVIADGDDIFGNGVNIASRLEAIAQPGCVALSEDAFRQVRDRIDVKFRDIGEHEIKNIERPIRVWEWHCSSAIPSRLRNANLPLPEKPSIVLLPFRNLTGEADQDFFAEGLRIDIQNALTQVSGVFLIATGSANALRGAPAREAGSCVGVRYALGGSVRKAGNRIRVVAELADVRSDQTIWSEKFDRVLDDTFELQDEITAKVLTSINVQLVAGEQAKIWHRTLKDPKALEIFYKGLHAFFKMDQNEMSAARAMFETVARMHPEVAIGPTWVALTYWFDLQRGWSESPETDRKLATKWAEQAAAIGDTDNQAHTVLSHVYLMERKFDEAIAAGREAIKNRPGCANANGFFANVLHYCGEQDEAISHINLAMRYQPLHPPLFKNILAASQNAKGDLDAAISVAEQALELSSNDIMARLTLISAYMRSDRQDRAGQVAAEIREIDPAFAVDAHMKSQPYRSAQYVERFAADLLLAGLPA